MTWKPVLLAALLLAGCVGGPSTSSSSSAAPGGLSPVAPSGAPQPAAGSNGTVLAAVLNRTDGGIGAFRSGVSGVVVFSDGVVLRFEGLPWGARERTGSCAAAVQAVLDRAAAQLGDNATVRCGPDMVQTAAVGRMGSDDVASMTTFLNRHVRLDVPPSRQSYGCCDRVFTTRQLWNQGAHNFIVDEHAQGPPAATSDNIDAVLDQLDGLGAWMARA